MTAIQRLRRTLAAMLVALAATTAAVAGGLAATVGTAHAAEFPGGELLNLGSGLCLAMPADQNHSYTLVNVNSGKCLGIYRAATAPGSLAVQWTCQASAVNQRWNGVVPT